MEAYMQKEIRMLTKEAHYAALELAAYSIDQTVSAFVRQAALEKAAKMGYHPEQPRVD